jgi:hypothetical protein
MHRILPWRGWLEWGPDSFRHAWGLPPVVGLPQSFRPAAAPASAAHLNQSHAA